MMQNVVIKITHIIKPDLFWAIDLNKNTREILESLEKIEPQNINFHYDVGSIVMAEFEKRWCRVKLLSLQYTSNGRMFRGFLLDHGIYDYFSEKTIRKLPIEYQDEDPLAMKVKVSGITASKRTVDFQNERINIDQSRYWSQASFIYVKKIIDKCTKTTIRPVKFLSDNFVIADVYIDIYDHTLNLSEQLIQECFAVPKKDENFLDNYNFIVEDIGNFENYEVFECSSIQLEVDIKEKDLTIDNDDKERIHLSSSNETTNQFEENNKNNTMDISNKIQKKNQINSYSTESNHSRIIAKNDSSEELNNENDTFSVSNYPEFEEDLSNNINSLTILNKETNNLPTNSGRGRGKSLFKLNESNKAKEIPNNYIGRGKWLQELNKSVGQNKSVETQDPFSNSSYIFLPAGRNLDNLQ